MSKPLYHLPLLLPVLLVCLCAAGGDFLSIPESAAKKLLLEHGSRDRISFGSDGVRIRDSKEAPGGRWRLLQEIPGDMDLEVTMRFNDPARQGGYAGIIFDRKTPGTPGIGISLTERGTHLQVNFPPENKIEYLLLEKSESSTFRLRVQCKGDNIRVSVNGSVVLDRTGIERAAGDFCFRIYNSDVTFSNLVIRNAAELNLRNQLPNGSFEDALSPNMPLYWGISAWGNCEDHLLAMGGKLWNEWRRDTADPVHGRYAMRVAGCSRLGSCLFPVQANTPYTLTGWLRSEDENTEITVKYLCMQGPKYELHEKRLTIGRKWQRIVWQLPPTPLAQAEIGFYGPENGAFLVDAVSVTAGTTPPENYIENDIAEEADDDAPAVPEITAAEISGAPDMAKLLADPLWRQASVFKMVTLNGGAPQEPTEGYLMHNADTLYIGIKCSDSRISEAKANVTRRDGFVWQDDCIELFIGPSGRHQDWNDYFHLGISITGAIYDARKTDPSWNGDWSARTGTFGDRWEMVAAIPLKSLELSDFTTGDWIINFCRENGKISENSAWSPTYGNFHTAERFGTMKALPDRIIRPFLQQQANAAAASIPFEMLKLDGSPFIPYGVTLQSINMPGKHLFQTLEAGRMNTLVWAVDVFMRSEAQILNALDLAQQHNVKIIFWVLNSYTGKVELKQLPEFIAGIVRKYRHHPALLGWMVMDEPHDNGDIVAAVVAAAKQADPDRPVFINVTPHGLGMKIGGLPGDIMAFDRYGFGFDGSKLADIGVTARAAVDAVRPRPRPVWAFLQGFGHDYWVPRCPTPDEMTAQVYLSLVSGVTGYMFFNGVVLAEDTWQRTIQTGDELRMLMPLLADSEEAQIQSTNREIRFLARKKNGRIFLIAVNPSTSAQSCTFTVDNRLYGCREIFAGSTPTLSNGKMTVEFRPLERRCFELF